MMAHPAMPPVQAMVAQVTVAAVTAGAVEAINERLAVKPE